MTLLTTQPQSIPQPGPEGWLKGLPKGLENFPGGKWCWQSHWGIFFTNNGFVIKEFHLPVSILHFNQRHSGFVMAILLKHTQKHRNPLWGQAVLPTPPAPAQGFSQSAAQTLEPGYKSHLPNHELCSWSLLKTALDPNTWDFLPGFSGIVEKNRGFLCT